MNDPTKWFEEAADSGRYQKEVIDIAKSCISKNGFNINRFMNWVLEQLEKDTDGNQYG